MVQAILESRVMGAVMKVTAIDPDTGIEATVTGPSGTGEGPLRQLALRKLENLLQKEQNKSR